MSDSIFKFDRTDKPDLKSEEEQAKRESKCLVLFLFGEAKVLTWQGGEDVLAWIDYSEGGEFSAEDFEVPENVADGLYIGEFAWVDDGPESYERPDIHDGHPGIMNLRPVTQEEWEHHRRDEFPWEPLKGSHFYDDFGNRDQDLDENGKPT